MSERKTVGNISYKYTLEVGHKHSGISCRESGHVYSTDTQTHQIAYAPDESRLDSFTSNNRQCFMGGTVHWSFCGVDGSFLCASSY